MFDNFRSVGERNRRRSARWNGWAMLVGFSFVLLMGIVRGPFPHESRGEFVFGCVFLLALAFIAWRTVRWGNYRD